MATPEEIRFLSSDDTVALEFCAAYLSSAWLESLEDARSRLLKYAKGEDGAFCLVAWVAGAPIGMMVCVRRSGLQTDRVYEPWSAGLYVVDALRKQGIGGRILERVQVEAAQRGYTKLHLATDKEHLKKWYQSLGWSMVGKAFDEEHPELQYDVFRIELKRES